MELQIGTHFVHYGTEYIIDTVEEHYVKCQVPKYDREYRFKRAMLERKLLPKKREANEILKRKPVIELDFDTLYNRILKVVVTPPDYVWAKHEPYVLTVKGAADGSWNWKEAPLMVIDQFRKSNYINTPGLIGTWKRNVLLDYCHRNRLI